MKSLNYTGSTQVLMVPKLIFKAYIHGSQSGFVLLASSSEKNVILQEYLSSLPGKVGANLCVSMKYTSSKQSH